MKSLLFFFFVAVSATLAGQVSDSLPSRVIEWSSLSPTKQDNRIRRQIMEGSTTSLSRLAVHATTLEPGKEPHAPHVHADEEELIIILAGELTITIKDQSKVLGPGSIAFAMPGDEHGIRNTGSVDATYYILRYKSKLPMNVERANSHGGSFMINRKDPEFKKSDRGGRRDFFNRPTSQLEKFEMHTTALNPGLDSHAPHTHKEEEIVLIIRGNVEMHIDGKLIPATRGDVVFLSSMVPHALKNTGREQCEYFAFQWRN